MSDRPQTWHYGLMAQWWAEFNVETGEDLAYFQAAIARGGEPALDVACGTGRLLVPLLQAGLDVDGCDLSSDMLALCRRRAEQAGHAPRLYAQAMHELDLPRAYRTIFICGGFGIGGQREQDAEALLRCYRHLAPGGTLVFDHHLPYEAADKWPYWLAEQRQQLPEAWSDSGTRRQAANGDEYDLRARVIDLDPLAQRLTLEMCISLWRAGKLVAEDEHTLQENLYFRNEVLLLLAQAGFGEVTVHGGYSEREPTTDDTIVVFTARK